MANTKAIQKEKDKKRLTDTFYAKSMVFLKDNNLSIDDLYKDPIKTMYIKDTDFNSVKNILSSLDLCRKEIKKRGDDTNVYTLIINKDLYKYLLHIKKHICFRRLYGDLK